MSATIELASITIGLCFCSPPSSTALSCVCFMPSLHRSSSRRTSSLSPPCYHLLRPSDSRCRHHLLYFSSRRRQPSRSSLQRRLHCYPRRRQFTRSSCHHHHSYPSPRYCYSLCQQKSHMYFLHHIHCTSTSPRRLRLQRPMAEPTMLFQSAYYPTLSSPMSQANSQRHQLTSPVHISGGVCFTFDVQLRLTSWIAVWLSSEPIVWAWHKSVYDLICLGLTYHLADKNPLTKIHQPLSPKPSPPIASSESIFSTESETSWGSTVSQFFL